MTFEQVFNIPRNHTLREIQLTLQSKAEPADHWLHEEYDNLGNLVAKYASWQFASLKPIFKSQSGFKKYNCYGQLIKESSELNLNS